MSGNGTVQYDPSTLGIMPGGTKKWVISFHHLNSGHPPIRFNAFVTDFSDDFRSNWERTPAYGRMDPLHAFQNTERTITLGWNVPAYNVGEARTNLKKMGKLAAMLYPNYTTTGNNASTISSAPIFKVKFNNLISDLNSKDGVVCTIDGFTFSPNFEAGMFDPDATTLLPKEYKLNCTLFVLHTQPLGWSGRKLRNSGNRGFYGASSTAPANRVGGVPTVSGDPKGDISAATSKTPICGHDSCPAPGSDSKSHDDVSESPEAPVISKKQASAAIGRGQPEQEVARKRILSSRVSELPNRVSDLPGGPMGHAGQGPGPGHN